MKKKLLVITLSVILVMQTLMMSSCYFFDSSLSDILENDDSESEGGDKVINVEGGDSYDVTIESSEGSSVLAASKALLSSVSVYCKFRGGGYGSSEFSSAGSGVIYRLDKEKGDAYVITNYHVVYSSSSSAANKISHDINLYLYGQEHSDYAIPATYVGGSLYYDIAVLKVEASEVLMKSNATAATFANSDEVSVLDSAIAIGNPESGGISATVGHVNVDSEYIAMYGADERTEISLRVIRTDAAVNSGNSGGGLFNAKGDLIGIVNAKISKSSVDNIGYAIPSNVAKYITENILYYCDGQDRESVFRCMLGITVSSVEPSTVYDVETGKIHKLEKVRIEEVDNSSAVKGKLKVGDIINSIIIDGEEYAVTRRHHVIDNMLNARPESKITFKITRNGAEAEVSITATKEMLVEY